MRVVTKGQHAPSPVQSPRVEPKNVASSTPHRRTFAASTNTKAPTKIVISARMTLQPEDVFRLPAPDSLGGWDESRLCQGVFLGLAAKGESGNLLELTAALPEVLRKMHEVIFAPENAGNVGRGGRVRQRSNS